ncbi:hypothetical protein DICPUDRAFT_57070 [Dictyostelium purpureum]|uniref:ADF-H domain-containing protein n=1 Tax=Dictyostelium purpureum TaxID=5786 RepID=F0ZU52_DICPU|nr:uncharacterized protein DICPUDRAFT_57070 [Dictyostelium purpureum]EGC32538.1 hypothetical protein DICPUDRAFT_57070 [Dictyostelium purpureum]|eukprot:XP_003290950.1 hypothetical protein DICPUDRAFT_57070 [Dictyostelium purpureum]
MSSGVKLASDCVEVFNQLKLGRKFGIIVYKISADSTQIEVEEKVSGSEATFDKFLSLLPENNCRYVLFDYAFEEEGANKNKITFVQWCPETSKIKEKMLYTSSKDALRKALVGIQMEIQGTDKSEVDHAAFKEKVNRI